MLCLRCRNIFVNNVTRNSHHVCLFKLPNLKHLGNEFEKLLILICTFAYTVYFYMYGGYGSSK
jgi:hypothetical protein